MHLKLSQWQLTMPPVTTKLSNWQYVVFSIFTQNHLHDDVIKWKDFPRYWPFVRGIHRSPVNSPHKKPVTRSFDVFFDLRLNKELSKQPWGWWFETPSRPLWRYCNVGAPDTIFGVGFQVWVLLLVTKSFVCLRHRLLCTISWHFIRSFLFQHWIVALTQ